VSKEAIYNTLGIGIENKLTYAQLRERTGLTSRQIRYAIADLVKEGYPIPRTHRVKGFFICKLPEEAMYLEWSRNEAISRIRHLNEQIQGYDSILNNINQTKI